VVRRGHAIALVRAFLIGCAVALVVVGCARVRSGAPEEEQGHTGATTKEQARSPEATASEEGRCGETRPIDLQGSTFTTNDVPGCPHGGLLSGTDQDDYLAGKGGDDEIRGLGAADEIHGGYGTDVIYGGPGGDFLVSGVVNSRDRSKSVLYGGDGGDHLFGAEGEDVLYGGAGNDWLDGRDRRGVKDTHRDELYCGEGRDHYFAGRLDYVSSSCEEGKLADTGGPPLILLAGAALLLSSGLVMSRYLIRRAS
jgi:RTX calcium-binding nonapeptide repeat (4 copies)